MEKNKKRPKKTKKEGVLTGEWDSSSGRSDYSGLRKQASPKCFLPW